MLGKGRDVGLLSDSGKTKSANAHQRAEQPSINMEQAQRLNAGSQLRGTDSDSKIRALSEPAPKTMGHGNDIRETVMTGFLTEFRSGSPSYGLLQ